MATELLRIVLPLRIVSVANMREHFMAKAKRAKAHRFAAWIALKPHPALYLQACRLTITLTRIAPRDLDTDNLVHAFKATRDGVADWLGYADNHQSLMWVYAQRKGKQKQYAAEITIARDVE